MGRSKGNRKPEPLPHPPRLYKLLTQVAKFYRRRFAEEPRARTYLAERSIEDKHALEVFWAGYCDGTLQDVLPFDDQVHDDLHTLGVLKDNGRELFRECVVFPLWDFRGVCVGMYGRRLFDSEVPHLYLPDVRRGLVNWQAAKRCEDGELVLTESVIDALSLYAAGVTGAVPCYGTGGFTADHATMLKRFGPDRIAVCFDADEPGRNAAAELAAQVESQRRGVAVRVIELPEGLGDELRVAATGKHPATGTMRTQEYTVKARTAVMMTTTDPDFDEETKSRFILATVNESAELTHRILEVQRQADTIEGIALSRRAERIKRLHQNAQRLLERVTVANPYAPKLTFPSTTLQARRDNKKYLGLIKAVTLLHQHQRERRRKTLYGETVEYIEATLDDIAIANRIAKQVWGTRQGDVTPQARQLFGLIRKMLINGGGNEKGEVAFTRRTLREFTGWSDWQVRTHLGELCELEYVRVRRGKFGKEYVYELSDTHLLQSIPGFGLTDTELGEALYGDGIAPRLEVDRTNLEAISANLVGPLTHLEAP